MTRAKVKGKKRHIVVDTLGMMREAQIQPTDIQDRDDEMPMLKEVRSLFPSSSASSLMVVIRGAATSAAVRELGTWHL